MPSPLLRPSAGFGWPRDAVWYALGLKDGEAGAPFRSQGFNPDALEWQSYALGFGAGRQFPRRQNADAPGLAAAI